MIIDQHELRVYSGSTELEPLESAGTLTIDRGWSPFVQGRLAVRAPDTLALTEPGTMIRIELTQRFGDVALVRDLTDVWTGTGRTLADLTTEQAGVGRTVADLTSELITATSWNTPVRAATGRTFTLVITERNRTRDVHSLQLRSNEYITDKIVWYDVDANLEGVPLTFDAETAAQYVQEVLAAFASEATLYPDPGFYGAGWVPGFVNSSTAIVMPETSHTIEAGVAPFDALQQHMAVTRQMLYAPGDGTMVLIDQDAMSGPAFTVTADENLVDWEITSTGLGENIYKFTGSATDPDARPIHTPYAFPEANIPHTGLIEVPAVGPTTPGGLSNGQQSLIDGLSLPKGLDASPLRLTTVSDYSARPGSPITYTLPDEDEENDTIDAITWQLGGRWEMDIWV